MAEPRQEYQRERQRLTDAFEAGDIAESDYDAIVELVDAFDEQAFQQSIPVKQNGQQDSPREPGTLRNWIRRLRKTATEICLLDADENTINGFAESLLTQKDLSKGTVRQYQSIYRVFYDYHDDTDIERTDVHRLQQEKSSVDPRDMLTEDEIKDLRQATDHARDLAMFDMFLYTGQRSQAIRTLRLKDIDLQNSRFKLNESADGLKGANDHIRWRSLLLAESSLSDWINQYHPDPDPDHYVFCSKGIYNDPNANSPLTRGQPQTLMNKLKDRADIDKPLYPHMLRHNFVNLAINEYDMDPHYTKLYIGHSPDSRVMESTYSHLTDDDVSRKAEQAFGVADEKEDESPLTPSQCPRCNEPLPGDAKACSSCGLLITPDAQTAQENIQSQAESAIPQVESDLEAQILQRVLKDVRENPEEYLNS